jgi:sulfatase maturation enzyme AslB (radical SAM superfamily)
MNLIITESCTNNCPYCFAAKEMSASKSKMMSKVVFDEILEKISSNPTRMQVNIIGGEPMIHKNIKYFVNKLEGNSNVSRYTILTGGVVPLRYFDFFNSNSKKLSFLFNINQKQDYRDVNEFENVHNNLGNLVDRGFKVSIGYNIYKEDFDAEEIIGYCVNYGITQFRTAVAKPTYGINNPMIITPNRFNELSNRVTKLILMAREQGINVNIDCMLPKCFFNEEQLNSIIKAQPNILDGVFGHCGIGLDVTPEKKIFRCFAVEGLNSVCIDDFESFDSAQEYFFDIFDRSSCYSNLFDDCVTCKYNLNHSCIGDCYARWNTVDIDKSMSSRIEKIYSAIEDKQFRVAKALLDESGKSTSVLSLLWAYYYMFTGQNTNAINFSRRAINLTQDNSIIQAAIDIITKIESSKN